MSSTTLVAAMISSAGEGAGVQTEIPEEADRGLRFVAHYQLEDAELENRSRYVCV
jgi:hypothetical protein